MFFKYYLSLHAFINANMILKYARVKIGFKPSLLLFYLKNKKIMMKKHSFKKPIFCG